jgi:hypothetical protein
MFVALKFGSSSDSYMLDAQDPLSTNQDASFTVFGNRDVVTACLFARRQFFREF